MINGNTRHNLSNVNNQTGINAAYLSSNNANTSTSQHKNGP